MMKIFNKLVSTARAFWKLIALAESNTYYPEERRKSKMRIFFDNLLWIFKKREVNYFYFLQGFDKKEGVCPDDFFALPEFVRLRDAANSGLYSGGRKANYTCLLQDKFLFSQYLKSLGFKTPETIALYSDGSIIWIQDEQVEPVEKLAEHDGLEGFLKPTVGWQGENIYRLAIQNKKILLNTQETDTETIKAEIQGKYIIQSCIRQHPVLSQLYPESVNTLRIVTVQTSDDVMVLSSVFRMGANGNVRDNWCSGGIAAGVDAEGALKKYGYLNPKYGRKVTHHPNTNVSLEGFKIPYYQEAVEAARQLHSFFYGVHSVGWDIAITKNGPVFIEGNDDWGIRVIQPHDHEFKKRFLATLK